MLVIVRNLLVIYPFFVKRAELNFQMIFNIPKYFVNKLWLGKKLGILEKSHSIEFDILRHFWMSAAKSNSYWKKIIQTNVF